MANIVKSVKQDHIWITYKEEKKESKTKSGLLTSEKEKDEHSGKIGVVVQVADNLNTKYSEGDEILLLPHNKAVPFELTWRDGSEGKYYLMNHGEILSVL